MNKVMVKKIIKEVKNSIENNSMIFDDKKILDLLHTYDKNFEYVDGCFYLKEGYTTSITKKMLEDTHAIIEYKPYVSKKNNDLYIFVHEFSFCSYEIDATVNFFTEYKSYCAYDEFLELNLVSDVLR